MAKDGGISDQCMDQRNFQSGMASQACAAWLGGLHGSRLQGHLLTFYTEDLTEKTKKTTKLKYTVHAYITQACIASQLPHNF